MSEMNLLEEMLVLGSAITNTLVYGNMKEKS